MQTRTCDVTSKTKVVGQATYKVYDSVAEAIGDMGEAPALALLNTQSRTTTMNRIRASAAGSLSKKALYAKAVASLTKEDMAQIAGDEEAVTTFLDQRMAEIKEEAEASAPVAEATEEGEEEGE